MKKFEDICRMTQEEVKAYMKKYLISKKYDVIDEDGFLYAKGTNPVLLVAHMDTVHTQQCNQQDGISSLGIQKAIFINDIIFLTD